jgi:hypothetical protein
VEREYPCLSDQGNQLEALGVISLKAELIQIAIGIGSRRGAIQTAARGMAAVIASYRR